MCQALKELFREDFQKEFETIRVKEYAKGHAGNLIENINNLINNLGISLENACQAIGSSVESYEEAKKLLEE